jgi:hypothetical protein
MRNPSASGLSRLVPSPRSIGSRYHTDHRVFTARHCYRHGRRTRGGCAGSADRRARVNGSLNPGCRPQVPSLGDRASPTCPAAKSNAMRRSAYRNTLIARRIPPIARNAVACTSATHLSTIPRLEVPHRDKPSRLGLLSTAQNPPRKGRKRAKKHLIAGPNGAAVGAVFGAFDDGSLIVTVGLQRESHRKLSHKARAT